MKRLLKKAAGHSVGQSVIALVIIQLANVAFVFLIPFLTRTLGLSAYGMVAIVLASIQFAFVITDYGFSLNATYTISRNRHDKAKVADIVGSVFSCKLILVPLACLVMLLIPLTVSSYSASWPMFAVGCLAVVGMAIQPIWLFRGIEQMKAITFYNVITKALYVAAVLWLVTGPEDGLWVILGWGIAQMAGGLLGVWAIYQAGYRIGTLSLSRSIQELRDGFSFFVSRLAVSSYASLSGIIVGHADHAQAAHYSVGQLVYKAGSGVTSILSQAIYPNMAKDKNWKIFWLLVIAGGVCMMLGGAFVAYFAEEILMLLFGKDYAVAAPVLRLFLLCNVITFFGVMFGYPAFAALERVRLANSGVLAGALVATVFLLGLLYVGQVTALGVVVAVLAAQVVVLLVRLFYLARLRGYFLPL